MSSSSSLITLTPTITTDGILDSQFNYCYVYLYNRKLQYIKDLTEEEILAKKKKKALQQLQSSSIEHKDSSIDEVIEDELEKDEEEHCIYNMFLPQYNITMNIFKLNIPEEQQDNTNLNQTSEIQLPMALVQEQSKEEISNNNNIKNDEDRVTNYIIRFMEGEDEETPFKLIDLANHTNSANFFVDMRKFKKKLIKKYEKILKNEIKPALQIAWSAAKHLHICQIKSKSKYIQKHPYYDLKTIIEEDPHKEYLTSLHDMKPNRWPYATMKDIIKLHKKDKKQIFKRRFGKLPLHIAILMGAPYEIILAVYKLNEAAIKEIEYEDKYTTLHLAIYASQTREVVKFVLEKCPQNIKVEDKYGEYPIHLTHNDETLFTLVDYFVQKHDLVLNNDKSNRLKQQIDQVNDEKLKLDIDLTNLNAELEFLNGKLKKYMEKHQQQQQQNDNSEKNKKRETKIYKMENLVQTKENEIKNTTENLNKTSIQLVELKEKLKKQEEFEEGDYSKLGKLLGCHKENKKGELPLLTAVALGSSEKAVNLLYNVYKKGLYDVDRWGYNVIHYATEKPEANELLDHLLDNYPIKQKDNIVGKDGEIIKLGYPSNRRLSIARNKLGYRPLDIARLSANQDSGLVLIIEQRRQYIKKQEKLIKVCDKKIADIKTKLQLLPDEDNNVDNTSIVAEMKKIQDVWKRRKKNYEKEIKYFQNSIDNPCISSSLSIRKYCKCNDKIPCIVHTEPSRMFSICTKHNFLTQANLPIRMNHKDGSIIPNQYSCKSCTLVNFLKYQPHAPIAKTNNNNKKEAEKLPDINNGNSSPKQKFVKENSS